MVCVVLPCTAAMLVSISVCAAVEVMPVLLAPMTSVAIVLTDFWSSPAVPPTRVDMLDSRL